jgi:hypothetical protein
MKGSFLVFVCRLLVIGSLSLCIAPPITIAGWQFLATTTSDQTQGAAQRPAQLVTALSRNRIKYTTNVWTLIVHLDTQRINLVNHPRKRYWVGPVDEYFSTLTHQLHESQQKAEKMLQTMPLEQSQRLRAFSRVDPFDPLIPTLEITTVQAPKQLTIVGKPTQQYEVCRNGEPYEETWIAAAVDVTKEIDGQKREEFVSKLQQARTTPPGAVLAELTDLVTKGYPLKTVNLVSRVTKEVVEVQQRDFTDEEFAAPSGYAESPLTEAMSLR